MKQVSSVENPKIKQLRKLSQKKYRRETGLFVVENPVIIRDALASGHHFEALYATEGYIGKHREDFEYFSGSGSDIFVMDDRANKYFSSLETPSGVAAVYPLRTSVLDAERPVIYLNGVSDPGNLGTILRTALAFGFINIVIDEKCADIYGAKTVNAAKDAIFKLNIIADKGGDWLASARGRLPIYATGSHSGEMLETFKSDARFCLVMGNEGQGVDNEIVDMADRKIMIEMPGNIESLNVAIATGIILHKLRI